MKSKHILITGGLGFIFSHVTEYFASRGHKVTVIDNVSAGSHPELEEEWKDSEITLIKADINSFELQWLAHGDPNLDCHSGDEISEKGRGPDIIIHAAAESDVDKSIHNQKAFLHSNVNGTLAMLEFARNWGCKQFLYINTDEVYGSRNEWCTPEMVIQPANPYSASKAAGGHMCWAYANTYGLNMQEVRMCNIIGQRQATTKLLPRLIDRIQNGEEMPIYDGGTNTREYMDVRDVAPLLERVLESEMNAIFNLTSNQEMSILEVLEAVERALDKKAKITPSSRPGHDTRYRMAPHGIMYNEVGQRVSLHKIDDTIKWMLSNANQE